MAIKLEVQERRVILSHIDNIINQSTDNLLVECLYALAVQLSPARSNELVKYTQALNDIRSIEGQKNIQPIDIVGLAVFSASNGYYYFKFNDSAFGIQAKISHSILKAQFNFTFNRSGKYWQLKQTKFGFNVDNFIETIKPKISDDFKRFKS